MNRDKRLIGIVSLGDIATGPRSHLAGKALRGVVQEGGRHPGISKAEGSDRQTARSAEGRARSRPRSAARDSCERRQAFLTSGSSGSVVPAADTLLRNTIRIVLMLNPVGRTRHDNGSLPYLRLDSLDQILDGFSIVCRSDAAAIVAACRFEERAAAVEVWEHARRVASTPQAGLPPRIPRPTASRRR